MTDSIANTMVLLKKDILEQLECPGCKILLTAPVLECVSGHSFCKICVKTLKNCTVCSKKFTTIRNYSLEGVLTQCKKLCEKCADVVPLGTDDHKYKCSWEVIHCQLCSWEGERIGMHTHVRRKHKNCLLKSGDELKYNSSNLVLVHKKQLIWIKQHSVDGKLFWSAQLIFPCKPEERYFLTIKISGAGEVYKVTQQCKGNHEEVVTDGVVAVISKSLLENKMRKVVIKVTEDM